MSDPSGSSPGGMPPVFPPPENPDDPGRGPLVMGITWTFSGLAIIAIAVRFWIRIAVTKLLAIEDWLMLLAGILLLVNQSFLTYAYSWGMGKHDTDLTFEQLVNAVKWMWIASSPGILCSIIARISICILLVRIFGTKIWLKWFLIVATIAQAVLNMALFVLTWTQSDPIDAFWNPTIPARRMNPKIQAYVANVAGASFAFGDLIYVLLPVIVVWRLNMALHRKIGLIILLALSIFTMGTAIAKAVYGGKVTKDSRENAQYNSSLGSLWGKLEQTFVIIMGCAPTFMSISKLEVGLPSKVASSLRGLIRSSGSTSHDQNVDSDAANQFSTGAYYELKVTGDAASQSQRSKNTSRDGTASGDVDTTRSAA